jgi:hypothetical protein
MKMNGRIAALVLALAIGNIAAKAQTTYSSNYTSNTPFYCDAASAQPLTSFQQFSCRGIVYDNANHTVALEYSFQGGIPRNWYDLYQTNPPISGQSLGTVTETQFTLPSPIRPEAGVTTIPGQFAFKFTMTDAKGVLHSGTVSGTWVNYQVCGGRGCYWWIPKLLSNSITINNQP